MKNIQCLPRNVRALYEQEFWRVIVMYCCTVAPRRCKCLHNFQEYSELLKILKWWKNRPTLTDLLQCRESGEEIHLYTSPHRIHKPPHLVTDRMVALSTVKPSLHQISLKSVMYLLRCPAGKQTVRTEVMKELVVKVGFKIDFCFC